MSIDKRVVQMEFDNQKFESKMKTTINSLNELKTSLAISTGLTAGVDQITKRFTNLGIVGVTAIQNITNTVINAGKRMLRSLTIDPVSDGYDDYVRKLTSVQTIMNATGKSIKEVTGYFDQLDEYADKTIYNLDDMTSAFAKFTNAGIELDTSVPAIKGIANMVALAGQNAQAASSAMYNLSQSLSYGSLTTTDYKSLNLANVATKEWKEQIVAAAMAAGALKKNADGMYNIPGVKGAYTAQALFNEKLSEGWVSTETLLKVLKDYGDTTTEIGKRAQAAAQDVKDFGMLMDTLKASVGTGWTDTFELLFGNIAESKKLWTGVATAVGSFLDSIADARNEMLKFWKDNEGRKYILQGIGHTLIAIGMILETVENAFAETFSPLTGKALVEFSKWFKELAQEFKIGADTADKLKRIFKGFFSVIHIGTQAIEAIVKGIFQLLDILAPTGKTFLATAANIGDFLVELDTSIEKGEIFTKVIDVIVKGFKGLVDLSKAFGTSITNALKGFSNAITKFLKIDSEKIEPFIAVMNKIFNFDNLFDAVNTGLFAAILVGIRQFITSIKDITSTASGLVGQFSEIMSGVTEVLGAAKETLKTYQEQLKANVILKIAISIAVLAAALIAISTIDSDKLVTSLSAVGVLLGELFGSMSLFNRVMRGPGFVSIGPLIIGLLGLSTAVLIMASALKKIGDLDYETISKGLITLGVLLGGLVGSAAILSTLKGSLLRTSASIITLSVAMNILAFAIGSIADIKFTSLVKALGGMTVLLAEIAIFSKVLGGNKGFIMSAISLNILGTAMLLFSKTLQELGGMSLEEIGKGLGTLAVTLTILAIAMRYLPAAIPGAIALGIIGASLLLLVPTLILFGNMEWSNIGRAMTMLAGTMAILVIALNLMPGAIPGAIAMGIVSASLLLLLPTLIALGNMQLDEIGRSLLALGGALVILAGAMYLMSGGIPGAIAMGIVSAALLLLAPALKILGSMSLKQIGLALLAIAGSFTILGVASLVLAKAIPLMIALAGAVALLGLGLGGIGFGLSAFATGLAKIAALGTEGVKSIVNFAIAIVKLLPDAGAALAKAMVNMFIAIGEGAPKIGRAITKLMLSIYKTITDTVPVLFKTLDIVLNSFLDFMEKNFPRVQAVGYAMFIEFLHGLDDNIDEITDTATSITKKFIKKMEEKTPELMQAGVDFVVSFINSMAETIRNNDDRVIKSLENLSGAIGGAVLKLGAALKKSFKGIAGESIAGLTEGFSELGTTASESMTKLGTTIVSTFTTFFGISSPSKLFKELGEFLLKGLSEGIEETTSKAVEATTSATSQVASAGESEVASSIARTKTAFEKFKEWLDDQKYYNKITLSGELEAWNEQSKLYKEGSDERKEIDRNEYRLKNELEQDAFQRSLNWIEKKKYYNELTLEEELAAWERVQSRYVVGSDERERADREIYRVRKELLELTIDAEEEAIDKMAKEEKDALDKREKDRKAEFQNSLNWIDEKKYYNELSLKEELDAWTRVHNRYLEGSEERKRADRELYRLRNEIAAANKKYEQELLDFQKAANREKVALEEELYSKVKSINDRLANDVENLNNKYKDAVKTRAGELTKLYGIFDKPKELEKSLTGEELTQNLLEQVFAIDNWRSALKALSERDIDKGLLDELRALGPSATNQLKELNKFTADELQKYVLIWKTKNNVAREQAELEMVGLRNDTVTQINLLKREAADELDEYRKTWITRMNDLAVNTNSTLVKMKSDWVSSIGEIRSETEREISELSKNIQNEITKPSWSSIGNSLMTGLLSGMRDGKKNVTDEAISIASQTLGTMRDILAIQSPSKKMAEIGRYAMQGFIDGISSMATNINTTVDKVGTTLYTKIHEAILKAIDMINNSLDYNPTIRPVMDLSDVYAGARIVNGLLTKPINASPTTLGLASSIQGNSTGGDVRNEFNIASLSVREEADVRKVARELYNLQVTRGRG